MRWQAGGFNRSMQWAANSSCGGPHERLADITPKVGFQLSKAASPSSQGRGRDGGL